MSLYMVDNAMWHSKCADLAFSTQKSRT